MYLLSVLEFDVGSASCASCRKKPIHGKGNSGNHLLSIVEKAYDPKSDLTHRDKTRNNFSLNSLIMIFSMKTPMHMFRPGNGISRK